MASTFEPVPQTGNTTPIPAPASWEYESTPATFFFTGLSVGMMMGILSAGGAWARKLMVGSREQI